MRAAFSKASKARAIRTAMWVVVAAAAAACQGGGAGGPGVEPPWKGDDISAATSGRIGGDERAGSGGTTAAEPGVAGTYSVPDGPGGGTGPTTGTGMEDGAGGSTSVVAGGGGGDLGGINGSGVAGTDMDGLAGSGKAGSPPEPEATDGCRAPQEPGCDACCEELTDGGIEPSCLRKSASSGSDWYNSDESLDGPCPADCQPCASCSLRDEEQLSNLEPRPDCDCDSIVIGIDPCFLPMGCECYCQSYLALTEACPQLAH